MKTDQNEKPPTAKFVKTIKHQHANSAKNQKHTNSKNLQNANLKHCKNTKVHQTIKHTGYKMSKNVKLPKVRNNKQRPATWYENANSAARQNTATRKPSNAPNQNTTTHTMNQQSKVALSIGPTSTNSSKRHREQKTQTGNHHQLKRGTPKHIQCEN